MGRPSAAARRGGSDESFRVDVSEFKALNARIKKADKAVARKMRKVLKAAADDAVKAAQQNVLADPPARVGSLQHSVKRTRRKDGSKRAQVVISGYKAREDAGRRRSRGMRKALSRATTSSLTSSPTSATLRVVTAQRRMPSGMGPMVKAYNTRLMFRHPVFGDRDTWVYQGGTAYFTEAMREQRAPMERRLAEAMEQVARELM